MFLSCALHGFGGIFCTEQLQLQSLLQVFILNLESYFLERFSKYVAVVIRRAVVSQTLVLTLPYRGLSVYMRHIM